jgi:hypothetical protein
MRFDKNITSTTCAVSKTFSAHILICMNNNKTADPRFGLTTYLHGRAFRSRLEARWSLFFDQLGIRYQYEPEIFAGYLVDFFVPKQPRFDGPMCFEIKPEVCINEAYEIISKHDSMELPIRILTEFSADGVPSGYGHYLQNDNNYRFCQCPHCGIIGFQYEGCADRLGCRCVTNDDHGWNSDTPALMKAYRYVANYRF